MGCIGDRLEKYFRDSLRVRHIVLTGMGRSAITAGLRAMGISKGDEVVVPAFICPAVEMAVRMSGATPVFAGVDRNSFNLTVASVESVLSQRCRSIIVSHTYGFPVEMEGFRALCDKKGLFLIEDCVSSLERYCIDRSSQIYGDIAIFSIYKAVVNTGGGFAAINNDNLAVLYRRELEKLNDDVGKATVLQRLYSSLHNLFSSIYDIYGIRPPLYNMIVRFLKDFHKRQTNANGSGGGKRIIITRLECLLAYLQLPLLRRQVERRLNVGSLLTERVAGLKCVRLLPLNSKIRIYKVLPVFIEGGRRDDFVEIVSRRGFNAMRPWSPLCLSAEASFVSDNVALVPIGPYLSEDKIDRFRKMLVNFGTKHE